MSVEQQLAQFIVDPIFKCRLWTGAVGSNGRPIIWRGRAPSSVHVVAYELEHGAVPPDRVLDHVCRRPACFFVEHLEPVTKHENERRKSMPYRMRRVRCMRGHRLDEATRLLTPEGGVLCRVCARG